MSQLGYIRYRKSPTMSLPGSLEKIHRAKRSARQVLNLGAVATSEGDSPMPAELQQRLSAIQVRLRSAITQYRTELEGEVYDGATMYLEEVDTEFTRAIDAEERQSWGELDDIFTVIEARLLAYEQFVQTPAGRPSTPSRSSTTSPRASLATGDTLPEWGWWLGIGLGLAGAAGAVLYFTKGRRRKRR